MKILIADDHELFLKGLQFVLESNFQGVEITAAQNYTQIFECLEKSNDFDLIITDLAMPGANCFDALEEIHRLSPETPIIIISAIFDKDILQRTIEAGVSGYIPKSSSNQLIISAIHLVLAGGVYIPHELMDHDMPDNQELNSELGRLRDLSQRSHFRSGKKLSPRQIDVVRCLARGLSNKRIAAELGLTEGTVKVHITVILKSLGVTNRTGAVIEAAKNGYIANDEIII
jgi:DNA-binding NarL/FixJ family response regulator